MITHENLFTNLPSDKQDEFISYLPWVEITLDLDKREVDRRYHVAVKTYLSYEGIDV